VYVVRGAPYAFFLYIKFHLLIKKKKSVCSWLLFGVILNSSLCAGHEQVSRHEALERARKLKLDLVEVQYFKFVAMVLVK
jgi:hypothetical protein